MTQAIVTPEFRLSFPHLFEPSPDDNGVLRFRMEMLIPKAYVRDNPTCLNEMKALYNSTIPKAWLTDGGVPFRRFEQAFIDGDTKKQEERKGHWILRANSGPKYPPRLKKLDGGLILSDDGQMYAGCFCRSVLTAYNWTTKNKAGAIINRGASFNISTVQKTRHPDNDGAPFSKALSGGEADRLLEAALGEDEYASLLGS